MDDHSTAALLERHRSGETAAFTELVRRYEAPLLRHARGLLGIGGAFEDAVQDAFLKLAQAPPELPHEVRGDPERESAHLAAWLHKVTRNQCMDTLRSDSRRRLREADRATTGVTSGGLNAVDALDTRAAVERKLDDLPGEQREVLVLRLIGDKTYREIAEITGKKVGTVGWLISVGMKALSRELAPMLGPIEGATHSVTPRGGHASNEHGGLKFAQGDL